MYVRVCMCVCVVFVLCGCDVCMCVCVCVCVCVCACVCVVTGFVKTDHIITANEFHVICLYYRLFTAKVILPTIHY